MRPQEAPKKPKRGPQEAQKRPPKRPKRGPQDAAKLLPRGPPETYHEIPTNTHEPSDPQPKHGGGMGRMPFDLLGTGTESAVGSSWAKIGRKFCH